MKWGKVLHHTPIFSLVITHGSAIYQQIYKVLLLTLRFVRHEQVVHCLASFANV
jgi:hypothetical protein